MTINCSICGGPAVLTKRHEKARYRKTGVAYCSIKCSNIAKGTAARAARLREKAARRKDTNAPSVDATLARWLGGVALNESTR